jgi:hypothetical protein
MKLDSQFPQKYAASYILVFRHKHTNSPDVQEGGFVSGTSKSCCTKSCVLTSWKLNFVEEIDCGYRSEITETDDVKTLYV